MHGYEKGGKYRGGKQDREKKSDGPGKNAQKQGPGKDKSENHSQKAKRQANGELPRPRLDSGGE